MKTRPRLLGVGFAAPGFGFGRVFHNLYSQLAPRWDIEHLEFSPPLQEDALRDWVVHHTKRPAMYLGSHEFPDLLERVKPDVVLFYADLWQIPPYLESMKEVLQQPATVAYAPIDGRLSAFPGAHVLSDLDCLVVPTRFAANTLLEMFDALKTDCRPTLEIVPHGIDSTFFSAKMGGSPKAIRNALFPARPELADAWIVLNANRNQHRKRLDLSIEGFAQFLKETDAPAYLYLHCGLLDQGESVLGVAEAHGIADRVLTTGNNLGHPIVSDDHLRQIYLACDIGLNTSLGEGWGLVAFEHAAAGRAQMVPNHSACAELWEGAAHLIDVDETEPCGNGYLSGLKVDVASVADGLVRLWCDADYQGDLARSGARLARQANFAWPMVAARFEEVFFEAILSRGRLTGDQAL